MIVQNRNSHALLYMYLHNCNKKTKEKIFCGLSTESFFAIIMTVPVEISYKKVCNLTQVKVMYSTCVDTGALLLVKKQNLFGKLFRQGWMPSID